MSTILRTPAAATSLPPVEAPMSELEWKHQRAQLAAREAQLRKSSQGRAKKKAAPRVPDFLHHLPASTCEALMRSADHIDVFEKAKARSSGTTQSNLARKLASGSVARERSSGGSSAGSARSGSSGSVGLARKRRPHALKSLSAPNLGNTIEETVARRSSRGSVGDFEIRPHGSGNAHRQSSKDSEEKAEQRRQRRARREGIQRLGKPALVGLPPILPIAGGSITLTVGANGKAGTAELVGREAAELTELGGLISPSAIESFDFSTAFMTPEMLEEKKKRRARLRRAMRTAQLSVSMHKDARDKQQSQAFHSFLGGMKSRTRVKSLVNRHVRDENRRLFAATAA